MKKRATERARACKYVAQERPGLEREMGVSGADLFRTRLAGTLVGCNAWVLHESFAFGLTAVNRQWAATERLEGKHILEMVVSRAAKFVK